MVSDVGFSIFLAAYLVTLDFEIFGDDVCWLDLLLVKLILTFSGRGYLVADGRTDDRKTSWEGTGRRSEDD